MSGTPCAFVVDVRAAEVLVSGTDADEVVDGFGLWVPGRGRAGVLRAPGQGQQPCPAEQPEGAATVKQPGDVELESAVVVRMGTGGRCRQLALTHDPTMATTPSTRPWTTVRLL